MTEQQQENQSIEEPAECGRLLRRTREGLGLSVADIASELHLSKHQIQALEEDDWDRLPGVTYARGYLRSYARLINLDPEELLAGRTTQELQISQAAARDAQEPEGTEPESAEAEPAPRRGWTWLAGVAVVAVLGTLGWQMYRDRPVLPDVFTEEPNAENTVAAGDPEQSGSPGEPQGTAFAEPGHEAATAVAVGGSEPEQAATIESGRPATPTDDRHVVFQFDAGSWVDVRDAGGERLLYRSYQPGRRIEVEGAPPFRVFIGNAPGVQVEYGGEVIAPEPATGRRFARFVLGGANG